MNTLQTAQVDNPPSLTDRVSNRFMGWPSHLISAAMLLWLCWYARLPSFPWVVLALYLLWILFLILWLVALMIARSSDRMHERRMHWSKWSVTPALVVLGFVVSYSGIVCRVAFELNRPALDRLARQMMASPNSSLDVRSVGVYQIEYISYRAASPGAPEAVLIDVAPFSRHEGFTYCPKCVRSPHDYFLRLDLGGGWYTFAVYSA
jgi:hypothetical protein